MSDTPLAVHRRADGSYVDDSGRVRIVADLDPTHPWVLYVDAWFFGRWPRLIDASRTGGELLNRAVEREAVTA